MMKAQTRFADALQGVLPTTVAGSPISWLDPPGDLVRPKFSNIWFEAMQIIVVYQHPQGRPERGGLYLEQIPCPRLSWVNLGLGVSATER